jgi:hypothetical protein
MTRKEIIIIVRDLGILFAYLATWWFAGVETAIGWMVIWLWMVKWDE